MKITFICGCLEQGGDGVGDYTRLLASEIVRQGHDVIILALHDPYINGLVENIQGEAENTVKVLRLSSSLSWKRRVRFGKEFIKSFNPLWISIQYVPFAFQKKGLPIGLRKYLRDLSEGINVHIMFHELWVGINSSASKKIVIWGYLQKRIISGMLRKLNPVIIHTQTLIYQKMLKDLGFETSYLPLFSNIPIARNSEETEVYSDYRNDFKKAIKFIVFGTIHPNAPIVEFASALMHYAEKYGLVLSFAFIGRLGREKERWLTVLNTVGLPVEILGEQPSLIISETLLRSSCGITTTPLLLTDKSGTVMAMREHGLPVICVSNCWTPRKPIEFKNENTGIFDFRQGIPEPEFLEKNANLLDRPSVVKTGIKFMEALISASKY